MDSTLVENLELDTQLHPVSQCHLQSSNSWFTSLQVDLRDFSSKEQSLVAYNDLATEEVYLAIEAENGMTINFKTPQGVEKIVIGDASGMVNQRIRHGTMWLGDQCMTEIIQLLDFS